MGLIFFSGHMAHCSLQLRRSHILLHHKWVEGQPRLPPQPKQSSTSTAATQTKPMFVVPQAS
ncbi:hypothetical protein FH972_002894 [Carpinus fangiana]|uniref:Uncharacterized protein n=1 Tax=Carpinus fangiana TaxID=176857 RepID=A0A5N6QI63_9ROSI|nr:hypothetical protein FH972_002894 [Carpinus fangiana]